MFIRDLHERASLHFRSRPDPERKQFSADLQAVGCPSGVKGGCGRRADGTAGLSLAPEIPVRSGTCASCHLQKHSTFWIAAWDDPLVPASQIWSRLFPALSLSSGDWARVANPLGAAHTNVEIPSGPPRQPAEIDSTRAGNFLSKVFEADFNLSQ